MTTNPRLRIRLPIRHRRPAPIDTLHRDVQAAGSFPFTTTDNRTLAWIAFAEVKGGRIVATLIGFDDPHRRDMDYSMAQSFGGNFTRISKLRGTELAVRQYVESQGWKLDAPVVIRG